MKNTKQATQGAVSELAVLIANAVWLQQRMNELSEKLKGQRAAIKEIMQDNALPRFATAAGHEALLIEKQTFSWNVEKLEAVLSEDDFDTYCPRAAKGADIRAFLEQAETGDETRAFAKDLRKCAKVSKPVSLEIRAAGADVKATQEQEEAA